MTKKGNMMDEKNLNEENADKGTSDDNPENDARVGLGAENKTGNGGGEDSETAEEDKNETVLGTTGIMDNAMNYDADAEGEGDNAGNENKNSGDEKEEIKTLQGSDEREEEIGEGNKENGRDEIQGNNLNAEHAEAGSDKNNNARGENKEKWADNNLASNENENANETGQSAESGTSMINIAPKEMGGAGNENAGKNTGLLQDGDIPYGNNGDEGIGEDSDRETAEDIGENSGDSTDNAADENSGEEASQDNNENAYLEEGKRALDNPEYMSTKNQRDGEGQKFSDESTHKFELKWIVLSLIIISIVLGGVFIFATKLQFTGVPPVGNQTSPAHIQKPASKNISNLTTIKVGKNPTSIVFSPDGESAYVVNSGSGTVSVINVSSNSVIKTINVGADPGPISITPNGKYIYVPNYNYSTISLINATINKVSETIVTGLKPGHVFITPDGKYASLYDYNYINKTPTILIINTLNNQVEGKVSGAHYSPTFSVGQNGSYAFIIDSNPDLLSIVNASNGYSFNLSIQSQLHEIAIAPDNRYAYITNEISGSVSVIDLNTHQIARAIYVGAVPTQIIAVHNSNYVYVVNSGSGTVSVINTDNNEVAMTINVGADPGSIAATSNGAYIFTANSGNNTVSIINASTNKLKMTSRIQGNLNGISVSPNGKHVYVLNYAQGTVSVE